MGTCTILVLVLVLVLFSDRTWQRHFGNRLTVYSRKDLNFWFFLIVLTDAALKNILEYDLSFGDVMAIHDPSCMSNAHKSQNADQQYRTLHLDWKAKNEGIAF